MCVCDMSSSCSQRDVGESAMIRMSVRDMASTAASVMKASKVSVCDVASSCLHLEAHQRQTF